MLFATTDDFSVRVTKITVTIGVSWTHSLPFYFFNLFKLNELWPYYQKHVNQIILNRTTLWSLALRIFEAFVRILLIASLSLYQTLLTFLLCDTNLDESIDSGNFSVRGYLPLIRKDSRTHMHGLVVYVKEGLPFAWDLSLENSADSYVCFQLALLHSVSYFFFLYWSPSSALCTVFDSISSNIDEVLSINPSANVFVFGDFNVHHKDWLTYSSGTDRPGELCYNFSISNDLTQIVNFPIWIPDCDSHSPALLDLFLSSDASICSAMAFSPLGNSDHVVVSVSIDFPTNSQQGAPFHRIAYDYSRTDWDGLRDHLRDVPWEDIFKLSASAAASEFCEWVQIGIDVYIPHRKYQVKPHSSPWFSPACAAAIVHRNHFFRLYQREKSSDSKVKFRQASNHCKRVLEAAKLTYANKTKESITSQKLGSHDFWRIANSVLNKGKSAIPPLFNGLEVLSSASDKAKLFAENFSLNANLDDPSVSLLVFPSRTNLKLELPRWSFCNWNFCNSQDG